MDGMHRIAKCLFLGQQWVHAVQFEEQPSPHYTNVQPDELPTTDVTVSDDVSRRNVRAQSS